MVPVDIATHPAGEHLDTLFCELVMNWSRQNHGFTTHGKKQLIFIWHDENDKLIMDCPEFKPSINLLHAMEGVEKFIGYGFNVQIGKSGNGLWCVRLGGGYGESYSYNYAKTLALAITRALILWAMEKVK